MDVWRICRDPSIRDTDVAHGIWTCILVRQHGRIPMHRAARPPPRKPSPKTQASARYFGYLVNIMCHAHQSHGRPPRAGSIPNTVDVRAISLRVQLTLHLIHPNPVHLVTFEASHPCPISNIPPILHTLHSQLHDTLSLLIV